MMMNEAQTNLKNDEIFIHPKLTTHDDETTHEEETDEDDTFDPIVHTPSHVLSSDDEDSDNEVEGMDVEGEKSDEDATYIEDQGNEADRDTNANLEGIDDVKADVVLPQVQSTQEIEDTHVTLNPVNPDGRQQSYSVSSGFVSNMLNPNQDTGVDAIFVHNAEATSLVNIPVTAITELSFFAPTNHPPTPTPLFTQLQQPPILIQATTPSSSLQNLPNFGLQLYKALVDAYEADKILLDTYGDTVTIKRPRDGADDDQEPSARTDRGSKRRRSGKEPESTSAPREKTTTTAGKTTTGSKTHKQSASQSALVEEPIIWQETNLESSFDELTDTTFDFSAFVMNRLNVTTLTPELLAGPTFELMKGTCKSLTELEYFCEEVYKATTEKLDWINPEGRQYPHDLRKPLPLVPNSQGRHVIPFHHFINNDLEYLRGGESSRKYSTSVTKTKAADYGHIKWIEDLVPQLMRSQVIVNYDKFALWGISHWGKKRRQFYAFATTRESARDVYSKRRIIAVTKVEIVEWQNYKHLDWITVRRDDDILYKFKEGDFHRLRSNTLKNLLLLLVQGKVTILNVEERLAFNCSLRNFTRSVVIQRRVEDLQLGVESYQKKLNLTKPDTYRSNLRRRDAYTPYSDPRGFIYENKDKKNRLMHIDELHNQRDKANARAMIQAIDKRLKTRRNHAELGEFVVKTIRVDPHGFEGYLKMVVEVPDSS
ncbi:hypothetical protein Tco_0759335 [Tanacetum coccineum]